MTWPACAAEAGSEPGDGLRLRITADGSPSLWSERFAEGFHCRGGALAEARSKFVAPAQLQRFAPGRLLGVLDVGVGLAYNSAALLEAALEHGLRLQWWGLELDPRPLSLALAEPGFRHLWQPFTLTVLEQLRDQGHWCLAASSRNGGLERNTGASQGRWLVGDGRPELSRLMAEASGSIDLILHDAFSPSRCPELWSLEFLQGLAQLLAPQGRLLTYCSAAAVRRGLQIAGLELAALQDASPPQGVVVSGSPRRWSLGTAASPAPLPSGGPLRSLTAMEVEHLATRAAEPYRDPSGIADAGTILEERRRRQRSSRAESTSAWRRRWGLP